MRCGVLMVVVGLVLVQGAVGQTVARVLYQPGKAVAKEMDGESRHGQLTIWLSDGKKVQLVKDNRCAEDSVQLSKDKKTIGWATGVFYPDSRGEQYYYPTELHVWRGGKVIRTLKGGKAPVIEEWRYVGTTEIAMKVRGRHGPAYLELLSLKSGKRLKSVAAYSEEAKKLSWAKGWDE